MDDKKKKYLKPEAEVVDYSAEDIITLSVGTQNGNWADDDNGEDFGPLS